MPLLWQKVWQFALFTVRLEHGRQVVNAVLSLLAVSSEGLRNSHGDQTVWLTDSVPLMSRDHTSGKCHLSECWLPTHWLL